MFRVNIGFVIKKSPIAQLFTQYIKNTPEKSIVVNKTLLLCHLTYAVRRAGNISSFKVYVTTRMVKHLYDKKPAEEFDFISGCLHTIVKYPDEIYKNLNSKRGDVCLLKEIKGESYFCTIQVIEEGNENDIAGNYIAICFRLRKNKKENYLKKYRLLWSWKGGEPSS